MAKYLSDQDGTSPTPPRNPGWWAAVIDENGNEVQITEGMIHRACEELARSWTFPRISDPHTARC